MLLPHVLMLGVLAFMQPTRSGFSPVAASLCSTDYGPRSLRSVPSYTDTTTLTSMSTVVVSPAPAIVNTAIHPQVTVTETFTVITPKPVPLEDVLRRYQSEYILAHRHPTALASSTARQLLSASSSASHPSIPPSSAVPIYTSQKPYQSLPSANHQVLSSAGEPSQYPEYVHCSRTITYISRTTLKATMKSTKFATGQPSMQTITVTTTVYPANFTQMPAATKTTLVTVYTPAQKQTAKSQDDEL